MTTVAFVPPSLPDSGAVVVGILDERAMTPTAIALDQKTGGALTRAMAGSRFKGRKKEILALVAPGGTELSRIVLVGLGAAKDLDDTAAEDIGGEIAAHLNGVGETAGHVAIDVPDEAAPDAQTFAVHLAYGAVLRGYRFDKYRTKMKDEQKPSLATLNVMAADADGAEQAFVPWRAVADGVCMARDLANEPANLLYPEELAKRCETLRDLGVEVEVLGEAEMAKMGMGALLGVGQGSARESKLVVMQWTGAEDKGAPPICFVGKGVTFDTGGISIKPAGGMEDMKWDMGGSAVTVGLMKALAGRKAKANVVCIVGCVENMPDGNAQRPGDIVTSYSGQTIEVINTDAEGRLVLADALWYAQERFKPQFMVNLATLTGAIIVALGSEFAGLFGNADELKKRIEASGKAVGEPMWPMPITDAYDKDLDADQADMRNIGTGRGAGSSTAAAFLKRFVNGVDWAHIDIAGVTWGKKDKPTVPKGATGFGVRALDRLVRDHYEG